MQEGQGAAGGVLCGAGAAGREDDAVTQPVDQPLTAAGGQAESARRMRAYSIWRADGLGAAGAAAGGMGDVSP
ncbi:MAG: hypothetical protein ACLS7Z_03720 [Christensenellales bacterium]